MKSRNAAVAVAVFLMLSPGSLFADCPTISSHACCGGGFTWKTYSFTLDCATISGGVSVVTDTNCSLGSVHSVSNNASTQTVVYQYTIPTTSTGWEIRVDYDFNMAEIPATSSRPRTPSRAAARRSIQGRSST